MTISETGKSAFTLLELLFVIIIIGIMVGVSFPGLKRNFDRMQLDNFSRELQSSMNYLSQRSQAEGKVIRLYIDVGNSVCWAGFDGSASRIKNIPIPQDITVEASKDQVRFYPESRIEAVTVKLSNPQGQSVSLTSEGVLGRVKIDNQ